ncbi:hypothetical protein IQ273_18835 [Nodosilinea sp. LEGE 07298]|uniref:hypothetical protein n=1 Tax=Nodosilinea sp. LEGE 07298 TaxID=2777970 RepID=UPI00187FDFC7|nr:hypothetical protein [Nodosilinea sp. LEGE 07298]MBE9111463.1 hypothetical protein [Nodosilinea sp. LEGE 07298]
MPNALSIVGNNIRAIKGEDTLTLEHQLLSGRLSGHRSLHKEFDFDGETITGYHQWDGPDKETLLITVEFTFTGGNIIQKRITDEVSGVVVTVTFGYLVGKLKSVTEAVA